MSFGDYLRKHFDLISTANRKINSPNALWRIVRDIAKEDIIRCYPSSVDSDLAIPTYYQIFLENIDKVPEELKAKLRSNGQERFRVIIRNVFSSNAFHTDGLANQEGIKARKEINPTKKGDKIIYKGAVEYVSE